MNQEKMVLYSLNYAPELTGIGKYNGEMVEWLNRQGIVVDVVCANPYYPEWKVHKPFRSWRFNIEKSEGGTTIRCPIYVPAKPSTLRRLLHLMSFALVSIIPLLMVCMRRPQTLITVQPTLFCTPVALLLCKLFGIKSVLHIQDFELDAMFGSGLASGRAAGFFRSIALRVETAILRSFDVVSTISYSMMEKARYKGVPPEKLLFFPNWSDISKIRPDADNSELREKWSIKNDDTTVLYAGNLGSKQGLELLIETAASLSDIPSLQFFIVGDGANRAALADLANKKGLTNVHFKSLLPWEEVPAMLTLADVHIVMQKKGVADAVLPSKLTNILAAGGHAVVTAEPDTELGRMAARHPGLYTCVMPESQEEFSNGLLHTIELAREQKANPVARRYAELHLSKDAILSRFKDDIGLYVRDVPVISTEKG